MRTIGKRIVQELSPTPSGEMLVAGARFSSSIAAMSSLNGQIFMPKGVYRYKSHEAANEHMNECIALGMAMLAKARQK
jgi:hypothetical protein